MANDAVCRHCHVEYNRAVARERADKPHNADYYCKGRCEEAAIAEGKHKCCECGNIYSPQTSNARNEEYWYCAYKCYLDANYPHTCPKRGKRHNHSSEYKTNHCYTCETPMRDAYKAQKRRKRRIHSIRKAIVICVAAAVFMLLLSVLHKYFPVHAAILLTGLLITLAALFYGGISGKWDKLSGWIKFLIVAALVGGLVLLSKYYGLVKTFGAIVDFFERCLKNRWFYDLIKYCLPSVK
jgi:cation transport ATPase